MKLRGFCKRLICTFFLLALPLSALAQNTAGTWVQVGLRSPNLPDKIRAFERAIQLDPDYIEAHYYLGLALKKQGNFAEAKVALNRAYFKNPHALSAPIKSRILFELGNVHYELGEISEAEEALVNAKNIATEPALKGRILQQLGEVYLDAGRYGNALAALREGRALLPQRTQAFDQAMARVRQAQAGAQTQPTPTMPEATAQSTPANSETALDLRVGRPSLSLTRPPGGTAIEREPESPPRQTNTSQGSEPNRDAVPQPSARVASTEPVVTADVAPDRPVPSRRRETREGSPRPRPQLTEPSTENTTAIASPGDGFRQVGANGRARVRLDSLYRAGRLALERGAWPAAVRHFERLMAMNSDYRDVQNLLADARFQLQKTTQSRRPGSTAASDTLASDGGGVWLVGVVLSAVILLGVGVLVFSPAARARLYLWQGKPRKSAALVEKALLRNPTHHKLYALLAHIYLTENRRDDRAIRVFEKVLRLQVPTRHTTTITSILADHYLTQGRVDDDAIQILERELDSRLRTLDSKV